MGTMGVDHLQIFNSILFFLTSYILFRFIGLPYSRKPVNLPPGPKALPIIGHLHLLKKPLHRTLMKLSEEHGDVLFLKIGARKLMVVSSPEAVEECFTKNDIVFANRNETVSGKVLNYNCSTIGLSSYGDYWRNLRCVAALGMLSRHRLETFKNIRQEEVGFLLKEIYDESRDRFEFESVINLRSKLSALTLNMMTRMISGKGYYGKDEITNQQFQQIFTEMIEFHGLIANLEDYFPIFRCFHINKGMKKRMVILMNKIDRLLQSLIDEGKLKKTFIHTLLSSQENEPEFLTDQTIKAITLSLLAGGTETTATTLEWAISLLLNNPETMKRALDEIQTVVGEDRMLDETDLRRLNYLDNVITETLRLYPPVPLLLPHRSSEDCVIRGYQIPKDTMLVANVWKIQRDPNLWDDPDKFRPERFDGKDGREGFKMLPFGSGRRACPGANLARRMVALTLGALIQSFELEKLGEGTVDMTESSGMAIPKETPLQVLCKPRKVAIQAFTG